MKLIKLFWKCRSNFIGMWLFLFLLSIVDKTPYTKAQLFAASGLMAFAVVIMIIIISMITAKLKNEVK